jgi:hypothetical protein
MVEERITSEAAKARFRVQKIVIVRPCAPKHFGDFVADVYCDVGILRVNRDRGQFFLDIFDGQEKRFVQAYHKYPALLAIYEKQRWDLWELFKTIGEVRNA